MTTWLLVLGLILAVHVLPASALGNPGTDVRLDSRTHGANFPLIIAQDSGDGEPVEGQPLDDATVEGEPTEEGGAVEDQPLGDQTLTGEPVENEPVEGGPAEGSPVEGSPVENDSGQGLE
jgi:hypothetical protein